MAERKAETAMLMRHAAQHDEGQRPDETLDDCPACHTVPSRPAEHALIGASAAPDHSACTDEQIAREMAEHFGAYSPADPEFSTDEQHFSRMIRLLGTPAGGAGMVSEHEWSDDQFEAYQKLVDAGDDLSWVDTYFGLEQAEAQGDYDYAATEDYIEGEQRVAVLADHDEACTYTTSATSPEVQQHLLGIVRGTEPTPLERETCYRVSTEPWAEQVREEIRRDGRGNAYSDVHEAMLRERIRREDAAEAAQGTYPRPSDVSSMGEGPEVADHVTWPSQGYQVAAVAAADALLHEWEALTLAYREAKRYLPEPMLSRAEAYVDQVFAADSRMLGMQSIDQWMHDVAAAVAREEVL